MLRCLTFKCRIEKKTVFMILKYTPVTQSAYLFNVCSNHASFKQQFHQQERL